MESHVWLPHMDSPFLKELPDTGLQKSSEARLMVYRYVMAMPLVRSAVELTHLTQRMGVDAQVEGNFDNLSQKDDSFQ